MESLGPTRRSAVLGSELRLRVFSSVVLGAVALAATWAGGWPFALLWLAAGIAITSEWTAMTTARPRALLIGVSAAGLVGLLLDRVTASSPAVAAVAAGGTFVAIVAFAGSGRDRGWALAGFLYAAVVMLVPVVVRGRPDLGAWGILWMFAVVWMTDTAAYFSGRALGGPKLWPRISPKKTWSGFVGGLAGGVVAGALVAWSAVRSGVTPPAPLGALAVAAALCSLASQMGDLAESAMKRAFGVKDSGRLIPGHGGVMDRLDGFAAVALLVGIALAGGRLAGNAP